MLKKMKVMHACVLFALFGCLWSTASGLSCYTCNSVSDNSKCKRAITCPPGSNGCENVVRMENGILRITKRCQQFQACIDSSKQNYIQCSPSVQTLLSEENLEDSRNLPPSVCRSCCNTNRCNRPIFLKEISRVGQRNPGSGRNRVIKLVPSQPSIRDVRVRLLTSDAALITFKDAENHSADYFSVNLVPARRVRIAPIRLTDNAIPGVNLKIPKGAVAFLARGLTSGTQYRIGVVSRKNKGATYAKKILKSFVTMPRKPRRIKVKSVSVNSLKLFIAMPKNAGKVSYYSMSYRKASDPPRATRKVPNFNNLRMQIIRSLTPSTTYIVSAWTNIAGAQGRLLGSSAKVNLTVRTAVPAVKQIVIRRVHATSLTWAWRLPYYATRKTQTQFVVTVRDDTNGAIVVDTAIPSRQRRFTATDLTPQTAYTFSIRARSRGRNSIAKYSEPVFTLVRCYSCHEAISRDECDQYIECPANSGGCLNEVRRRSFTNTNSREPEWYRATLKCKQVTACNNSESQDKSMQCEPNRNRNVDPPDVCRCCCEGDLCNGPGSACGHILGWLDPFRSPEKPISTVPPFCPQPNILHGSFVCTGGESEQEIGSECTFNCEKDYYLVGDAKLNCFDNGRWNVPFPICLPRKTCSEIPESEGTILSCTYGFTSGSVCSVTCQSGYLSLASDSIRCELDGQWSSNIIPTCVQEDNCQPNPCQNGATCHDLANAYECECLEGWTGRHCETEVFCTLLYAPENGDLQCTNANRFASRCRYTCDQGYEQHGSTYTRCSADGYWTAFEPTMCVLKTCKVLPQSLINGGRAQCTGYDYGDECQFSCPEGLSLAGGPANITCQDNKQWSGTVPCCDLQCPPHAKVDLYFLLDSSSSVGRANWHRLINFTIALLDQFVIGQNDMVVGVGRYNQRFDQRSEISFGEYRDADHLKRKIRALPYSGQGTKTGRALWNLRFSSLKAAGNRLGVPDIVMVITDGKASDNVEVPAKAIKAVKETKIYAIGVINQFHEVNHTQLAQIASGPEYMQIIKDGYEELARTFSKTLTADVCWIPCQYQYEQREILIRQRQLNALDGDAIDQEYWTGVDRNRTVIAVEPNTANRPLIEPNEPEVQQATLDETVSSQVKKSSG